MNFKLSQGIRALYILLLVLMAYQANAQTGISIGGKVTGEDDHQPIHGVSVSISKKGIGTATNSAGAFALIIPAANLNDTLRVSCIGFKSKQYPINSLTNGQELTIALEKNSTELKEVTIHDPLQIIRKALRRIPDNYINHPHIIRGFYRMYTYNGDNPLQLSEAVFDVYNFGYSDGRADLFKLIKARNERNQRDFGALELGQKPNSVFEEDIVNHLYTSGFLSEEGLKKHDFEVSGVVDLKGYEAFQIDFKEKPGAKDGSYRGSMFIDTKTYAFIYFDFGLSPEALADFGLGNFFTHTLMKLGDVEIELKKDSLKVGYQEVGNKWVLSSVEGDDILAIKNPDSKDDMPAHVKFNYQVTAVDTIEKKPFSGKLDRNESINNHDSGEGARFWKDYNILLSDYDTEEIFRRIQDIDKLVPKVK